MSTFLDAIAQDPVHIRMARELGTNPFRDVIRRTGKSSEIFEFPLDATFVQPESLTKLAKYVKYIPLSELCPRVCAKSYFTVACVCGIQGHLILLSDLRVCKHILHAPKCPPIQQYDVIAIANAGWGSKLEVHEERHIIRIGHNNEVTQCSYAGTDDLCSGYVDLRKNPMCEHHCRKIFTAAGSSRMLLKQNTRVLVDSSPTTSPDRSTIMERAPLAEIPSAFVNEYLANHPNGRGAKFMKALDKKATRTIGVGFSRGDMIQL
jgi:hypothetical protein